MIRVIAVLFLFHAVVQSGDWPRFRGPNGSGVSEDTGPPNEVGPKQNLIWPRRSPTRWILADHRRSACLCHRARGKTLIVLCLDALTAKLLWRRRVDKARTERQTKPNDAATPTPVADESAVYAFFPEFGLIWYTHDGVERWRVALGPFNPPHGMATSPHPGRWQRRARC